MAQYVDGFVIPVPKRKVKAYLRMARMGARMWKEHGALAYSECVAEDLAVPFGMKRFAMGGFEVMVAW